MSRLRSVKVLQGLTGVVAHVRHNAQPGSDQAPERLRGGRGTSLLVTSRMRAAGPLEHFPHTGHALAAGLQRLSSRLRHTSSPAPTRL